MVFIIVCIISVGYMESWMEYDVSFLGWGFKFIVYGKCIEGGEGYFLDEYRC